MVIVYLFFDKIILISLVSALLSVLPSEFPIKLCAYICPSFKNIVLSVTNVRQAIYP